MKNLLYLSIPLTIMAGCSGQGDRNDETNSAMDNTTVDEIIVEEEPVMLVVHEDRMVHHDTKSETHIVKTDASTDEKEELMESPPVVTSTNLDAALLDNEFEPVIVEDTEMAIIPLSETETLISYNKKDKEKGVVQLVKDGDGEIQQIMFADKNHRDIYDVSAGLTAKEAKKLRKNLKHMIHRGHHFLYDDQSNIMYLLNQQMSDGSEVTEAEIDQMEIRAIVWKHKDHKERNNDASM